LGGRFQQSQQQRIAPLRDLVVVASLIAHAGENSMPTAEYDKSLLWNPPGENPEPPPATAIPGAHYAAIGRVTDAWADLEFEIDRAMWELMGAHQTFGACVTSQIISMQPKLRALRALLHLWSADDLATQVGSFAGLCPR
jgi:hypothetical protein